MIDGEGFEFVHGGFGYRCWSAIGFFFITILALVWLPEAVWLLAAICAVSVWCAVQELRCMVVYDAARSALIVRRAFTLTFPLDRIQAIGTGGGRGVYFLQKPWWRWPQSFVYAKVSTGIYLGVCEDFKLADQWAQVLGLPILWCDGRGSSAVRVLLQPGERPDNLDCG